MVPGGMQPVTKQNKINNELNQKRAPHEGDAIHHVAVQKLNV